jgi:Flp pilus assembly protein TadD
LRTSVLHLGLGRACVIAIFGLAVAACQETGPTAVADATSGPVVSASPAVGQEPDDIKYFRSDEPYRLGVQRFNEGEFGLAERYFQDAVEKAPRDVSAWVALAASYDRLARFDLADRAYRSAERLGGRTTQMLNNLGYSYMLRGDLVRAKKLFEEALRREPANPTIANNLRLLDSSSKYIQRAGGA